MDRVEAERMNYKVGCEGYMLEIESFEQRRFEETWCGSSIEQDVHMEAVGVVRRVIARSHCFCSCLRTARLQSRGSRSSVQCPQPCRSIGSAGLRMVLANRGSLRKWAEKVAEPAQASLWDEGGKVGALLLEACSLYSMEPRQRGLIGLGVAAEGSYVERGAVARG